MHKNNNEKVLIIGDVHGRVPVYVNLLKGYIRKGAENLKSIQIGDFGFEADYKRRNRHFEKSDGLISDHHLFFGGNHDEYDNLPDFHMGDCGSSSFISNTFFVRGARSIDKNRRTVGRDWWPEEELNWKQSKECVEVYEKKKPEIVLSHDGPNTAIESLFPGREMYNSSTNSLLETLYDIHAPKLWIFGHWHADKIGNVGNTTFVCLNELSVFEYDNSKTVSENIQKYKKKME